MRVFIAKKKAIGAAAFAAFKKEINKEAPDQKKVASLAAKVGFCDIAAVGSSAFSA